MKSKAAAGEEEETPKHSTKASVFVPLEQFVVNLQPDDGPQFLQTQMTLKVVAGDDPALPELCWLPSFLWLMRPASRASAESNSCALPEACAARPPSV